MKKKLIVVLVVVFLLFIGAVAFTSDLTGWSISRGISGRNHSDELHGAVITEDEHTIEGDHVEHVFAAIIPHVHYNTTHAYVGDILVSHVHLGDGKALVDNMVHEHTHVNKTHSKDKHVTAGAEDHIIDQVGAGITSVTS